MRVGTWIDGSPVYRVAFDHKLDNTEKEDKAYPIPNLFNSNIGDNISVINAFATVLTVDSATNYATLIDFETARVGAGGAFDWNSDSAAAITGWVEYVQRP